jgi:hypothetical protein
MQGNPTLTITNSTFQNNFIQGTKAAGAVVWQAGGAVSVEHCDFSANHADGSVSAGGALAVQNNGALTLTAVKFADNVASGQFARGAAAGWWQGKGRRHCGRRSSLASYS